MTAQRRRWPAHASHRSVGGIPVLILALLALPIAACGSLSGELAVRDAWARPALAGGNSAVYFRLVNGSATPDRLISVSTQVARAAEIHRTTSMDSEGGNGEHSSLEGAVPASIYLMEPVDSVEAPVRGQIAFEPGGLHLMLIDLHQDLEPGQKVILTLNFETAGPIEIEAPVEER